MDAMSSGRYDLHAVNAAKLKSKIGSLDGHLCQSYTGGKRRASHLTRDVLAKVDAANLPTRSTFDAERLQIERLHWRRRQVGERFDDTLGTWIQRKYTSSLSHFLRHVELS